MLTNKKIIENGKMLKGRQAVRLIYNYKRALSRNECTLRDVYGHYSLDKSREESLLREKVEIVGGWGIAIPTHTSQFFTFAFQLECEGKTYLVYETAKNRYVMEI